MTRMTKAVAAERAHYHHLADTMKDLERALNRGLREGGFIPEEWQAVAQAAPEPRRTKMTIRLDEDVVRFFRLMGINFHGRINQVLRAFMLARLSRALNGPESVVYRPARLERYYTEAHKFFLRITRQNERMAQGRVDRREELALRQKCAWLLDEEIALDLPPELRALRPDVVAEFTK
ncbi:BrnA antitoxin family protein [Pararhodobacter sp. SW119]|uniref:BrnA antitoxin family protein n=1 Tax=Pararhodobacter sp. SW119 TaxID=2780075 RepID=UPI001ADF7778|nr:BrnA antitoxin family protein [Pararhodobacter sp. SW119]